MIVSNKLFTKESETLPKPSWVWEMIQKKTTASRAMFFSRDVGAIAQSRPEPPVGAWSSYFPGVCVVYILNFSIYHDISMVIPWHVIFLFSPPCDSLKFRPTQVVSWLYHVISYPIPTLEQIISWGLVVRIGNSHHDSPCLLISLSPCCSAWPQFCCLSENGRFQAENDRSISALVSGKACRTTATKPEWSWSESQIYGFPMFSHVFPMCLSLVSHVFFSDCLWCSSVCSMVLNLQLYFFSRWFFMVFRGFSHWYTNQSVPFLLLTYLLLQELRPLHQLQRVGLLGLFLRRP